MSIVALDDRVQIQPESPAARTRLFGGEIVGNYWIAASILVHYHPYMIPKLERERPMYKSE